LKPGECKNGNDGGRDGADDERDGYGGHRLKDAEKKEVAENVPEDGVVEVVALPVAEDGTDLFLSKWVFNEADTFRSSSMLIY
jgi:hypothetical protein